MCILRGFIYSRTHTYVQDPHVCSGLTLEYWQGAEDAKSVVHHLLSLSEAGTASPAFLSLVVARESPVDVENMGVTA